MSEKQTESCKGCGAEPGFKIRVVVGLAIILGSAFVCAVIGAGIGAAITNDVGSPASGYLSAAFCAAGVVFGTIVMMATVFRERQ